MAVNFAYSGYDPNLYLFFIYLFLSKVYAPEFSIKLSLFNSVAHNTILSLGVRAYQPTVISEINLSLSISG